MAEKEALNEFHAILAGQTDMVAKARMLRHGFLPDTPAVLIESGMRCLPLIDIDEPVEEVVKAAVHRLRAIMAKLRLLGEDGQTAAALREFETVLIKYELADRQLSRTVAIIGVVLLFLLGAACFWLLGIFPG